MIAIETVGMTNPIDKFIKDNCHIIFNFVPYSYRMSERQVSWDKILYPIKNRKRFLELKKNVLV